MGKRDKNLQKKKRRQERIRQEKHRRLFLSQERPEPPDWEDDEWEFTTTPEERQEALASYAPPLAQLLSIGEPAAERIDCQALGLTREHVPELIRMATDNRLHEASSDAPEVYAPLHAWRALGELRAIEATKPLLSLLVEWEYDDWTRDDLPESLGRIGPAILPELSVFLTEESNGIYARGAAGATIEKVGTLYPEARGDCVKILADQVGRFVADDATLNGFLLGDLLNLQAVEALPVIERAFDAGCIDEEIAGDIENARQSLLEARRPKELEAKNDP